MQKEKNQRADIFLAEFSRQVLNDYSKHSSSTIKPKLEVFAEPLISANRFGNRTSPNQPGKKNAQQSLKTLDVKHPFIEGFRGRGAGAMPF